MKEESDIEMSNRIIREWRRSIPDDHPDVAFCILHALGYAHYQDGDYEDALRAFLDELPLRKKALGDKHISVADTLVAIGTVLEAQGRYKNAMGAFQEALDISRSFQSQSTSREEHFHEANRLVWSKLAETLYEIGNRHFIAGNFLISTKFYEAAVRASKESTQGNSTTLPRSIPQRITNAVSTSLKEAVRARESAINAQDLTSTAMLSIMGHVFFGKGEMEQALETYRQTLDLRRARLGSNHPAVADSWIDIGFTCFIKNDLAQAEIAYKEAIAAIRRSSNGLDSKEIMKLLDVMCKLGMVQEELGKDADAIISFNRALVLFLQFKPTHSMIEKLRYRIAVIKYRNQDDTLQMRALFYDLVDFLACSNNEKDPEKYGVTLRDECIDNVINEVAEAQQVLQSKNIALTN